MVAINPNYTEYLDVHQVPAFLQALPNSTKLIVQRPATNDAELAAEIALQSWHHFRTTVISIDWMDSIQNSQKTSTKKYLGSLLSAQQPCQAKNNPSNPNRTKNTMNLRLTTTLALVLGLSTVALAQTVGDGCMDISMVVERSYISSSEDNEFFVIDGSDEHVWYWYGRDLADLDGQDWRSSDA